MLLSASCTDAISLPPPRSLISCCTCVASVYQGLQTLALDVAKQFSGRARFAQPALVDGALGAVWAPGGQPRVVFGFTITHGKIVAIDILADPERLRQFDLAILND